MSRSGYCIDYDDDGVPACLYRQAVDNAMNGRRGQSLLRDLLTALDTMPNKALVAGDLETPDGEVCALGAVGRLRGVFMANIDPEQPRLVADRLGIAESLAREVAYINDEAVWEKETPEQRFARVRRWAEANIKP